MVLHFEALKGDFLMIFKCKYLVCWLTSNIHKHLLIGLLFNDPNNILGYDHVLYYEVPFYYKISIFDIRKSNF